MKKQMAIFLTALLLWAAVPALAQQATVFPQGYITGEQTELTSAHFQARIAAGVYVPGDLMDRLERIYNALETVSGVRFEDGAYYQKIEVVCRAEETSADGKFYNPFAYQNEIHLYPLDLVDNSEYTIVHELGHTLNYFYHAHTQDWQSKLLSEGFATYTAYKAIKWLEENDPALAYTTSSSKDVLYDVDLEDEETLYTQPLTYWLETPYPYSGNPGYSEGMRFMAYLDQAYGNYTAWMQALDQTAGGTRVEREVRALKASYGEGVLDGFYPWLAENRTQFYPRNMRAAGDLRGAERVTLYPSLSLVENVARLAPRPMYYTDLQVDLSQAMVYLRDYKGKDVSAAQLQLACSTSADVFDAAGNLLATIERKGTLPMADVAYVQLKGSGTVNQLEITGWGEFSR